MARILWQPPRPQRGKRERTIVAGRLAWFYREGTLLETGHDTVWECVHDHEYDSFPWWRER